MYERLKRLYNEGKLDDAGLANAVKKGWITQAQADEIIAGEISAKIISGELSHAEAVELYPGQAAAIDAVLDEAGYKIDWNGDAVPRS